MQIPFHRPSITEAEIAEVVACLRSGWLTTGPRTKQFEAKFAEHVNAKHAIALNSCTAALHLGVDALGLKSGQAVLVPAMTFAATAEVVRYSGATPILVDCLPDSCNLDLEDAAHKLRLLRDGWLPKSLSPELEVVGIMPVHVGGHMMDMTQVNEFARAHGLWVVEDGAHAFPASYRRNANEPWHHCGQNTAAVSCFSFYANKTITTGEGGMAVTDDDDLAERIRCTSLHGLSRDAWGRYSSNGKWDYQIITPGYKYNITDVASAIGVHQLDRAEAMRKTREELANTYLERFETVDELELPPNPKDRMHSWHLFAIRLRLDQLTISRQEFLQNLQERGVGFSVHWRPLHLHPYYQNEYGWTEELLPVATSEWLRRISLPIYPGMRSEEINYVIESVKSICKQFSKRPRRVVEAAHPAPTKVPVSD